MSPTACSWYAMAPGSVSTTRPKVIDDLSDLDEINRGLDAVEPGHSLL